MTEVIFIIVYDFIKLFQRLSTHCVDNLILDFHGLIIELYYRCMIRQRVIGMKKKHMSKPGVCVLYSGI